MLQDCLVVADCLEPLDVRDCQVHLVYLEILDLRVHLVLAADLAGKETRDLLDSLVSEDSQARPVLMGLKVLQVFQGQAPQPMASSSLATVKSRKCHSVQTGPTSSTMATLCSMCRATSAPTDRTSARQEAACVVSAPCPSCSATSIMSATSPLAMTTPTGCPRPNPCPCPWRPSQERASSRTSADVQCVRLQPW